MMFFRCTKIVFLTIVTFCFGFTPSCFNKRELNVEIPNANSKIFNDQEIKDEISVITPKGDELEVAIRVIKPQKAVLTILNKSADKVYLPYVFGERNGYAFLISFELQIRDEKTGEWKSYSPSDLVSDFNALESREFIKGRILTSERGTFRINISYLIDRRVYEKLNTISKIRDIKENLKEFEKIKKEFDLSRRIITSISFKL